MLEKYTVAFESVEILKPFIRVEIVPKDSDICFFSLFIRFLQRDAVDSTFRFVKRD